jgi:hypothetical protein
LKETASSSRKRLSIKTRSFARIRSGLKDGLTVQYQHVSQNHRKCRAEGVISQNQSIHFPRRGNRLSKADELQHHSNKLPCATKTKRVVGNTLYAGILLIISKHQGC